MKRIRTIAVLSLACSSVAVAQDVSQPAMLQYFESSWRTMERRAADVFIAGYGSMWTPPPSEADTGGGSVGYDVYDRFDLGSLGNTTQYGTERGLKALTGTTHRWGGRVYTDLILNHNGFATRNTPGFTASGGYPGFAITRPGDIDGDFHDQNYSGSDVYLQKISGLIDIAQEKNYQYIRNPVPGFANNLPAGTTAFFGKLANVASENNRRFYPDQGLGAITYTDPTLPAGQQTVTMYNYNTANPTAGDPVLENAEDYLMRHARWMIQEVGVDGFRLDAIKHFPPSVLNKFDRYVWKAIQQPLLNGQVQHTFSFGEALDGNMGLLQSYVKKNASSVSGNTIGGNRDALDFPLFFALRDNLTANGLQNNWNNVVNASFDINDGGAHNGSQGVAFVSSHDDVGVTALPRVAHAYTLMRPGNAIVYFNPKEFGQRGNNFPRDGRLDALGGFHGDKITDLVNIRNTHGRGNYIGRSFTSGTVTSKEVLAYERDRSALVVLNNRGDIGFDTVTFTTGFAAGTKLIDLTGNAMDLSIDPTNVMPDTLTVGAGGQVTVTVPRNGGSGGTIRDIGYTIYGLPTPQGTLAIPGVTQVLSDGTLTAANNATARVNDLDVITANSFTINLNTTAYVLPDGTRDRPADGDNALLKINGGLDTNGNGFVDFTDPAGVLYGFEQFTVRDPGYDANPALSGAGTYSQSISTASLPEGQNFITVRAFRQRSDGGPAVFTDFRKAIYVDRVKPPAVIDSIVTTSGNNREIRARSADGTANNMHMFLNLPASRSESQILGTVSSGNQADRDADLFVEPFSNVPSGNHVITTVTYEPTGNVNVQRHVGVAIQTGRGLGVGDTDWNNTYTVADVSGSQGLIFNVYPNLFGELNTSFNPASDVVPDGFMDTRDLLAMRARYLSVSAPQAVIDEMRLWELRRGNIDQSGGTLTVGNAGDIDHLYSRIGQTSNIFWPDLNVDASVSQADVDVLVRQIFLTEYGDANLDRRVDIDDFGILASNFNQPGGWALGNFDGQGGIGIDDFARLASNFNFVSTGPLARGASVPEPGVAVGLLLAGSLATQRRRAL